MYIKNMFYTKFKHEGWCGSFYVELLCMCFNHIHDFKSVVLTSSRIRQGR